MPSFKWLIHAMRGVQETRTQEASVEDMQVIYFTSGPFIRSAYTEEEVIVACRQLVTYYPVPASITLAALQSHEHMVSKKFLEILALKQCEVPVERRT